MNILIISPLFPLPLRSGGHTRLFNMLKRLSSSHTVDFISLISGSEKKYSGGLSSLCRTVVTIDIDDAAVATIRDILRPGKMRRLAFRAWCLLRGVPLEISGFFFFEMQDQLNTLLRSQRYDVVQLELSRMTLYFGKTFFKEHPAAKILVDYDLCYVPLLRAWKCEKRLLAKCARYIDYRLHRAWATRMWRLFDAMVVMSDTDRQKVLTSLPGLPVHVVPNGVDISRDQLANWQGGANRLLFIGGACHYANVDALRYFLKEIYPCIKDVIRDASLTVIGDGWEAHREALSADSSVQFAGFVEDLRTYAEHPAVLVAPIRIGGGTRLKILEAMAMGIPVVSSSIGCEGIPVADREHMMIADTPGDFAGKTSEVLASGQLRGSLRENGYKLVKAHYNWDALALQMETIYENAVKKP